MALRFRGWAQGFRGVGVLGGLRVVEEKAGFTVLKAFRALGCFCGVGVMGFRARSASSNVGGA